MDKDVFWAEKLAKQITAEKRKEYVCEGMWTPSGFFHIGNARPEIFTPYAVYLQLKDGGFRVRQNFVTDDFDPVEKIPHGIPIPKGEEDKYIGFPTVFAPSPVKGYDSWGAYFKAQVLDLFDEFGLGHLNVQSSYENYKSGRMNDLVKFSLDNSQKIVETWNRISGSDKPLDFLPVTVVCEQCKKIMFTEALSWNGKEVAYKCSSCGAEGSVSPLNGNAKLHWRVHWVATWVLNDVAFESAGKDHFSRGGSVDVGRALILDVFKKKPPFQIPTEFLHIDGAKMAGSVGNVFDLRQWIDVAPPELFRFMYFSYKPNSVIDFSLFNNSFILLNERFERAERIFYGVEKAENEKIEAKARLAYSMASIGGPSKKRPLRIPYSFAVQLSQLMDSETRFPEVKALLEQTGHITSKISKEEGASVKNQLALSKAWVEKYAPAEFKLSFLEKLSAKETDNIGPAAKALLPSLAKKITGLNAADEIQQAIFESAKSNNMQPKQMFRAVYLALTGKESGPRAGLLILAFGKEKCVARLKEVAN